MFWLKACPHCHGDLFLGQDQYGKYVSCLQCSRYLTSAEEAALGPGQTTRSTRPAARPKSAPIRLAA